MSVVWITGASSGIGAALARAYAAQGHQLVLSARRTEALEAVKASLPHPDKVRLLPLDVTDSRRHETAAQEAWTYFGAVDILIHSAGVTQRATALDTSLATTRALMEVNFFAIVGLSKAILPAMLDRKRGQIVVISSVAGYVATPLRSTYSAAKHAIRAWSDGLRAELHGTGLQVSVICPGYISTGISALALTEAGATTGAVEPTDRDGMSVDLAAQKMLAGIEARRPEFLVGGSETYSVWLQRWMPGLVRRLAHRFGPSKRGQLS